VAQHAPLSNASSLINSLGNSHEGNHDRDGDLSMLFSKKPLAQAGRATGPMVAATRRGGPLPRARMEGRQGASAADERAGDPAGEVRVLRGDPHTFTSILFLLLYPASGCLLLSAATLFCALDC
jgi:hypothetical protein